MKNFANLYIELEQEIRKQRRVEAIANYLGSVDEKEGAIALSIMLGAKFKSVLKKEELKSLACELANIESWMFEECLPHGNNFLDTVSLIIPTSEHCEHKSLSAFFLLLEAMRKMDLFDIRQKVLEQWLVLNVEERVVFNQLLCGVFKFKVSFDELAEACALWLGFEKGIAGLRLSKWNPMKSPLSDLRKPIFKSEREGLPETFQAYHDWTKDLLSKLDPKDFKARWVIDGLKVQVVKVNREVFVWGENERLLFNRFPEIENYFLDFPDDFMVQGTIIGWGSEGADRVILQQREGKMNVTTKVLNDFPVRFVVSEISQPKNDFVKSEEMVENLSIRFLERINDPDSLCIWNDEIEFDTWDELFDIQLNQRLRGSVGLEISAYFGKVDEIIERKSYFKVNESYSLNLILLYVKSGLYSSDRNSEEYTFGVRHESTYLPIARVQCISDEEVRLFIQDFVKKNTLEKFGPVRNIKPALIFEVSFTSIFRNERKKSGVELVNAEVVCMQNHLTVDDGHQMKDVLNYL